MPVKYSSVDPDSTRSAATLRSCISDWSFAMRSACSAALIGCASFVSEARRGARESFAPTPRLPASAADPIIPKNARLEALVIDSSVQRTSDEQHLHNVRRRARYGHERGVLTIGQSAPHL